MWCRKCCCHCRNYNESNDINLSKLEELRTQNPNIILLDVRSPQEYAEGHMQGSICIPSYEIMHRVEKIIPDKNATIVAYCEYGGRSRKTVNILKTMGYKNVYNLVFGGNTPKNIN